MNSCKNYKVINKGDTTYYGIKPGDIGSIPVERYLPYAFALKRCDEEPISLPPKKPAARKPTPARTAAISRKRNKKKISKKRVSGGDLPMTDLHAAMYAAYKTLGSYQRLALRFGIPVNSAKKGATGYSIAIKKMPHTVPEYLLKFDPREQARFVKHLSTLRPGRELSDLVVSAELILARARKK